MVAEAVEGLVLELEEAAGGMIISRTGAIVNYPYLKVCDGEGDFRVAIDYI